MATTKEYLEFILDGLSCLDGITYKQMMGEYILYYHGKITAYLCDNRFLVKPVPSAVRMLPDAKREAPYDGAKEMLVVDDVEDRDFLTCLLEEIYEELPEPKRRNK
ncbi:MAG: TfoX/Sxy family protein [Clostridia bacterium]|nr:TfoX/Sxy family protein [Clostridia bacterium]